MQIGSIRPYNIGQQQNQENTNFKGTVSPSVKEFINKCAKNEARRYVSSLKKGVTAEKSELLKIKISWNKVLNTLIQKVKKMHKDTEMCAHNIHKDGAYDVFKEYELHFKNEKINSEIKAYTWNSYTLTSKDFKEGLKYLKAEDVDDRLLTIALRNFKKKMNNNNLIDCDKQINNILEYQNELGTIPERVAELNKTNLYKAADEAKERIARAEINQRVDKQNQELLDEIFGSNL